MTHRDYRSTCDDGGARRRRAVGRGTVLALAALVALAACGPTDPTGTPVLGEPEPAVLQLSGGPGEIVSGTVSFANTGTAALSFETDVQPVAAAGWLSVTPSAGSVAAGATRTLTLSAQCPLTAADLGATLAVHSNDPSTSSRSVGVELECVVPPPATIECQELGDPATPTLRCEGDGWVVEVPWQGAAVRVDSLPLDGLGHLPSRAADPEFEPLSAWPVVHFGVVDAVSDAAVVDFDPPLWLSIAYDADDFAAATPVVGEGELALGVWHLAEEEWIVAGYGVHHNGFWVADPIGSDDLVLQGAPEARQPRFQITGTPSGGTLTALVAQAPETLAVSLGAAPFDMEHMVVEFDGGCSDIDRDGVDVVECISEEAGVTVRVPVQEDGTVTPLVIALPWNKMSTFIPSETPTQDITELERQLMNFLVVDAAEPTRVIAEFEPPMEFEILYRPEDRDPGNVDVLRVNYWDEYVEQLVVLGQGFTESCGESPGCLWGGPIAAEAVPEFEGSFFQEGLNGFGVAKFTYDIWGDRVIMFGR
ncbi:hypothetical protein BH23DEI1_BH23DEI1_13520 [soil metagenome]